MTVMRHWEHWWCPACGAHNKSHDEGYCNPCHNRGRDDSVVEQLVPAEQLRGAVEEAARLRDVLRAVLIEPDPIKRNQLAAPMLTNAGGGRP